MCLIFSYKLVRQFWTLDYSQTKIYKLVLNSCLATKFKLMIHASVLQLISKTGGASTTGKIEVCYWFKPI